MKLFRHFARLLTLLAAFGLTTWTVGCAQEETAAPTTDSAVEGDADAGSAMGGGTDVPPAPADDAGSVTE